MSPNFKLTTRAERDLAEIIGYVVEAASAATADHVLTEFATAFQLLAERPSLGHRRPDLTEDPSLRFWALFSWLVVYAPRSKPVTIVSIVHGARDPEDLGRLLHDIS